MKEPARTPMACKWWKDRKQDKHPVNIDEKQYTIGKPGYGQWES
jgi:hypothetical protein